MTTIEIIKGDFCEVPVDAASLFQAMITDPPYSEHVHTNITSAGTLGASSKGWHRQELKFGALTTELQTAIAAFSARVQGWTLVYSDHESSHLWRAACETAFAEYVRSVMAFQEDDTPEGYSGVLPWERWSQPQKSGDRPTQGFEVVSLFWGRRGSRKAWNGPGSLTSFRHKALRGEDKHRTEKPLDQALDMVSFFSNALHLPWGEHPRLLENGKVETVPAAVVNGHTFTARPAQDANRAVCDPCSGSGTVATACALLGRDFGGWEIDPGNEGWAERGLERALNAAEGRLSPRDEERVVRWLEERTEEAAEVPEPKAADGSDVKTWERAQRRLADVQHVLEIVE